MLYLLIGMKPPGFDHVSDGSGLHTNTTIGIEQSAHLTEYL